MPGSVKPLILTLKMGHLSLPCAIDGVTSGVYPACPVQFFVEDEPAPFNFEEQRSGFNQGAAHLTGVKPFLFFV